MDEEVAHEETDFFPKPVEPVPVCKCMREPESSEVTLIPERKKRILTTVQRTEDYIRSRRIPELLRFFMTKLLAEHPQNPTCYLFNLIESCMLFRCGLGPPPVLYEERHFRALIKSFDPSDRGWLIPAQIRKLYTSLGLEMVPKKELEDRVPSDVLLDMLIKDQEKALKDLVSANSQQGDGASTMSSVSTLF